VSRMSRTAKLTFALAVFGSGLVMVGGPPHVAHATTLTVNTAEDIGPDALTGRFPTDGKCSLRAAIRAAESNSNAHDVDCATGVPDADDVIVLDAGLAGQTFRMTYAIDGNVQPFDTIISGGPLSIVGETENAADFVISGEGVVRPFTLGWFNIAAASLTLANLTVANGDGTSNGAYVGGLDGFGGAFYLGDNGTSGSTLTLDNVVLKNNSAAFNGGAIYGTMLNVTNNGGAYVGNSSTRGGAISVSSGPFTLNGYAVAFEGNRASDKGGAIYSNPGNEPMLVHLERSLLRDNAAVSAGGVVYVDSSRREKVFELHDSTAIGNSSVFFAQANFQSFEILRSTFVDSGEIWRAGAGFIANSIVTGRSSCSYPGGPGIGGSRNLVDSPGCGMGSIGAVTGLGPRRTRHRCVCSPSCWSNAIRSRPAGCSTRPPRSPHRYATDSSGCGSS
jgi:CSLREA domain-containing protein